MIGYIVFCRIRRSRLAIEACSILKENMATYSDYYRWRWRYNAIVIGALLGSYNWKIRLYSLEEFHDDVQRYYSLIDIALCQERITRHVN